MCWHDHQRPLSSRTQISKCLLYPIDLLSCLALLRSSFRQISSKDGTDVAKEFGVRFFEASAAAGHRAKGFGGHKEVGGEGWGGGISNNYVPYISQTIR